MALRKIFQDFSCCLNLVRRLLGITGKLEVVEAQVFVGASVFVGCCCCGESLSVSEMKVWAIAVRRKKLRDS